MTEYLVKHFLWEIFHGSEREAMKWERQRGKI